MDGDFNSTAKEEPLNQNDTQTSVTDPEENYKENQTNDTGEQRWVIKQNFTVNYWFFYPYNRGENDVCEKIVLKSFKYVKMALGR